MGRADKRKVPRFDACPSDTSLNLWKEIFDALFAHPRSVVRMDQRVALQQPLLFESFVADPADVGTTLAVHHLLPIENGYMIKFSKEIARHDGVTNTVVLKPMMDK